MTQTLAIVGAGFSGMGVAVLLVRTHREQFMRHVGPYWDTHRHRAAPAIWRRIRAALDAGQLNIVQGRPSTLPRPISAWRK